MCTLARHVVCTHVARPRTGSQLLRNASFWRRRPLHRTGWPSGWSAYTLTAAPDSRRWPRFVEGDDLSNSFPSWDARLRALCCELCAARDAVSSAALHVGQVTLAGSGRLSAGFWTVKSFTPRALTCMHCIRRAYSKQAPRRMWSWGPDSVVAAKCAKCPLHTTSTCNGRCMSAHTTENACASCRLARNTDVAQLLLLSCTHHTSAEFPPVTSPQLLQPQAVSPSRLASRKDVWRLHTSQAHHPVICPGNALLPSAVRRMKVTDQCSPLSPHTAQLA